MKLPQLPPRGIFAVTTLVFDKELPSSVKETLLQLMALAWVDPKHQTPPLTLSQLADLTGKATTTLYGHIAVLRNYRGALRLRRSVHGILVLTLADWLYTNHQGNNSGQSIEANASEILESSPVKQIEQQKEEEERESLPPPFVINQLTVENSENRTGKSQKWVIEGGESTVKERPLIFSEVVRTALLDAGIFSFLFGEVAQAGRSEKDLLALLSWCQEDYPERPGGIFMVRLRAGAQVPARYYGERCDVCGKISGHTEDCRRRY